MFFEYVCIMDQKKQQIITDTANVFMRYGIKSVTMDDVARQLKISKKTLYKYVDDKLDLVCKVMNMQCGMERDMISEVVQKSENAIDEIILISKHMSRQLNNLHPSIHFDLEKYYPEAWGMFYDHKNEFIYSCVVENLKRGKEEGLFRENLTPEIVARLYVSKIDVVFDPEAFPPDRYRFIEVALENLRYHLRGIASPKGIEYLKKRMAQEDLNLF